VSREGTALSDGNAHGPADVRSGIATAAAYDSARSSTGRLTTNSELLCRGEASADRARLSTADRATARRLKPAEPAAHARTCPADTEAAADLGEGVVCPAVSAYGNLLYSHPCPSDPVELVALVHALLAASPSLNGCASQRPVGCSSLSGYRSPRTAAFETAPISHRSPGVSSTPAAHSGPGHCAPRCSVRARSSARADG
jgi:hypothetical protein